MAIVQVTSTNPKFTFLIRKNPGTGMQLRSVRKGMAYGWYTDESTYNVYFKDADNEVSFKQERQEQFEYLNVSRYNTPLFGLSAINEFFSSPLKSHHEQDVPGYRHTLHIPMIHIERLHFVALFERHLTDCTFETVHQAHKSYSLTLSTERSLYHLLHVASMLCLFLSLLGKENIDISDSILDKYIPSLGVIDAPFYIRSLFASHFLNARDRFAKYKAALEQTERYSISLAYGRTGMQRRNVITEHLPFDKAILDLGCGEGFYALHYAGRIEESYYAVDIDEELLAGVQRKAAERELDNLATYASLDRFLETYNGETVDVILTEVVEHMPEDEAAALVALVCREVQFDRLIITTPNADFNVYYELDGFRHDDHSWEMGQAAFRAWLEPIVSAPDRSIEWIGIGDRVDGIQTTQGAIVRRKEA
ncbi:class I SAM-dependent methyltransferase [Paenibacillus daejeonensis]|uniref:class I SAM-dependent methyltransferase n=1 Tax=Paenibacillus daejeonensis TaxID=135193 RepID=UPI0003778950|nr:class I SAM-dependent methyltransferase [Paenibacillus daejeonensis]